MDINAAARTTDVITALNLGPLGSIFPSLDPAAVLTARLRDIFLAVPMNYSFR
jgi:hypothetical protein